MTPELLKRLEEINSSLKEYRQLGFNASSWLIRTVEAQAKALGIATECLEEIESGEDHNTPCVRLCSNGLLLIQKIMGELK